MKKIFSIFILSILSFTLGTFVLAQNNNQNNTQQIRDLMQRVQDDSTCAAESTNSNDSITGQSNSSPSAACANVKKNDGIYFTPNVPIPGFFEGTIQITPNSIGLYINAVYRYGAGLAGIIAMFMIVFAAWQWIIAAGNSGKIENAKDTIIGALIGLALLFGGYLLLAQISSKLVNLGSLKITPIPTVLLDRSALGTGSDCAGLTEDACKAKPELCLWEWTVVSSGICVDKSICDLSLEKAYEQRNNPRLFCCGSGTDYRFSLKGTGLQVSCEQVCGAGFSEANMVEKCAFQECTGISESECKGFVGLCRWTEDDTNWCIQEAGQPVEDMDCNENSDCSIYDSNYCCNSADWAFNECRLRTENNVVCYQ